MQSALALSVRFFSMPLRLVSPSRSSLGDLKIALRGEGGVTWTPAEGVGGGGVGEKGFRVGPFVLCKNGCWRRRRRNTNFGPKFFFHQ